MSFSLRLSSCSEESPIISKRENCCCELFFLFRSWIGLPLLFSCGCLSSATSSNSSRSIYSSSSSLLSGSSRTYCLPCSSAAFSFSSCSSSSSSSVLTSPAKSSLKEIRYSGSLSGSITTTAFSLRILSIYLSRTWKGNPTIGTRSGKPTFRPVNVKSSWEETSFAFSPITS